MTFDPLPLNVQTALQECGWQKGEIATYALLLSSGPLQADSIAEKTCIKPKIICAYLRNLLARRVIEHISINEDPFYGITDLHALSRWMDDYIETLREGEKLMNDFIDQFKAEHSTTK